MSNENIHPSTLDGIKRLAKSIKAERNIKHTQALDHAAHSAGFENFKQARKMLPTYMDGQHKRYRVFLTKYWRNKELGQEGRETLWIDLDTLWSDLITPAHFKLHRALGDLRKEGPDHLANRYMGTSQSQARREICAAARTLQFIDATKLRPARSLRAYPGSRSINAVPGHDHSSVWYDSNSKRYLFADEPYDLAAKNQAAERAAWSLRHGFTIIESPWPGMYNPDGGTRLYLISDSKKGIPLDPIISLLDKLPPPIIEEAWDGESAPLLPIFVSPGAIAHHEAINKKPKPTHQATGQRNTVGYIQTLVGPQRRPMGKMPISSHEMVGKLLKTVLVASYYRNGVYNRINSVRSELDEWVQREYTHAELPDEIFFDLYYHESGTSFARTLSLEERNRHISTLENVKLILSSHYPDCVPLRSLQKKIDVAIQSIQNWVG